VLYWKECTKDFLGSIKFESLDNLATAPPVNTVQPSFRDWNELKGPLIGVGIVLAAGALFYYLWNHKTTSSQLQEEYETLREENVRLRIQSRHLLAYTKDLKKKNGQLADENTKVSERIQRLENRMMDLVEAMTKKDDNLQVKLLQQIYREQITALVEENASLKQKNDSLRDELDCSVCMVQEANCILRPCGHSLCTECYYEIQRNWTQHNRDPKLIGPPCPFCRQTIIDLMPKFNS